MHGALSYTAKTENSKQIFPGKELRGYTVPTPTFMFLWAIYIFLWSVCLFCCRKVGGPNVGIYSIDRPQTHECKNWYWGRAIPFLGIHKVKFLCSVYSSSAVQYISTVQHYVLLFHCLLYRVTEILWQKKGKWPSFSIFGFLHIVTEDRKARTAIN
jgi:hypothetical protein